MKPTTPSQVTDDMRMIQVTAAMQRLLYENPLYLWIPEGEQNLNVMVIGFDPYAAQFIDLCLQAGQMRGHSLHIAVFSQDPDSDRQTYLADRPALEQFVDVNGSMAGSPDLPYAFLTFLAIPGPEHSFRPGLPEHNQAIAEEILLTALDQEHVHYIFLSEEDGRFGRELAALFSETAALLDNRCCVNYLILSPEETAGQDMDPHFSGGPISHGLPAPEPENGGSLCRPVPVCTGQEQMSGNPQLERMAFCTHLLWMGGGNLDPENARKTFAIPYNRLSSISYALSLPYKLSSFGILLQTAESAGDTWERLDSAAERFEQALQRDPGVLRQMAALEHRRWVLEKVTSGWRPLTDYDHCIKTGRVNDPVLKLHPCICFGSEDAPLLEDAYTRNHYAAWNSPCAADAALDPLDRMSLELHRRFRRYTLEFRSARPMENGEPARLAELLSGAGEPTLLEYRRFCLCLKNILDEESGYSRQYSRCEELLLSAAENDEQLGETARARIRESIRRIRLDFFPAVESSLYRDYKNLDVILVRQIPFILTRRESPHLAMALDLAQDRDGGSDIVFRNTASATVLHPGRITYLYCFDRRSDLGLLRRKLLALGGYFDSRRIRCRLHLLLLFSGNASGNPRQEAKRRKDLTDKLNELTRQLPLSFEILDWDGGEEPLPLLARKLSEQGVQLFDGTNPLFAASRANAAFVGMMAERFPYFEFDAAGRLFHHDSRCSYLHYIHDHSYMRVEDMFSLMNAEDCRFHYPDFAAEYQDLWRIYTGDAVGLSFSAAVGCWNNLCGTLGEDFERRGDPDCFTVRNLPLNTRFYRMNEYRRLLNGLQAKGFITELQIDGDAVSLRYPSVKMRNLLTKAGEILEVYTYFEACKLGYFDDILCGYEFKWEAGGVRNELDCVMTKGFRSMIIECKARLELDQNFYYKLDSLAGRFGIGVKKVLIANTYGVKTSYQDNNNMQKARGRLMNIITISGEEDIRNIGKKLKQIMEESEK